MVKSALADHLGISYSQYSMGNQAGLVATNHTSHLYDHWSQPDLRVFLSALVFNPHKKEWTCHLVVSLAELAELSGGDSV